MAYVLGYCDSFCSRHMTKLIIQNYNEPFAEALLETPVVSMMPPVKLVGLLMALFYQAIHRHGNPALILRLKYCLLQIMSDVKKYKQVASLLELHISQHNDA